MKKRALLAVSALSLLAIVPIAGANPQAAGNPAAHGASVAQPMDSITGKIVQTMSSGGYSYMNIKKKDGKKVWVAVSETKVKVGDTVTVKPGTEMKNFESKSLKRTFESIIFSEGIASAQPTKPAALPKDASSPGSKGAATAKDAKIAVTKAGGANAYTVEGAYGNSAALNKKKVVIRGKVVKVSNGIMGKNWVHIQDGTGSQAKANHNMVCTTKDTATVGDVVTVSGTLTKDKDFGAGYKYSAIIEDAKLKK